MKKRFLVLALALIMLLQCGCTVAPTEAADEAQLADKIVSSDAGISALICIIESQKMSKSLSDRSPFSSITSIDAR